MISPRYSLPMHFAGITAELALFNVEQDAVQDVFLKAQHGRRYSGCFEQGMGSREYTMEANAQRYSF